MGRFLGAQVRSSSLIGQFRSVDEEARIVDNEAFVQCPSLWMPKIYEYDLSVILSRVSLLITLATVAPGTAYASSLNSGNTPVGEQGVRTVLAEIARLADTDNCDLGRLKTEIAEITEAIKKASNLEATLKAEHNAASLAFCGPRRHWELSAISEFVSMQLASAVLLQSRLPEQERDLDSVERDRRWATVLIEYARKFPRERADAELDLRMLEQGYQHLQPAVKQPQ